MWIPSKLNEQLILWGFASGERIHLCADEKILDCMTFGFICGKLMSAALENSLVSPGWCLACSGLFPFGFVPVDLGLSPGLNLSKRAASGTCSQVPLQRPWTSGAERWVPAQCSSSALAGEGGQIPQGLEWIHGFFSSSFFCFSRYIVTASMNNGKVIACFVLGSICFKN